MGVAPGFCFGNGICLGFWAEGSEKPVIGRMRYGGCGAEQGDCRCGRCGYAQGEAGAAGSGGAEGRRAAGDSAADGVWGKNVLEVAGAILRKHPPEALLEMGLEALVQIKGIGRAKAAGLVAGFELSRRVQKYLGHHRGFAQYEGRCPITVAGSRLNPFIPVSA